MRSAVIAYHNVGKNSGKTNCGNKELIFLATAMKEGRGRRLKMQLALNNFAERRRRVLNSACLQLLLISQSNITVPRRTQLVLQQSGGKSGKYTFLLLQAHEIYMPEVCELLLYAASQYFFFSRRQVRTGREILVSNNR